ncbi:MAG: superoxide dismutase [Dysgonamonadaceae bacterium]|jgi:Fe-Mn family superoxide dismutase|nr:superoxide dismutase [Dysgonamonadaceae bacterium]
MKFEMPILPYEKNALAPVISEETVNFHWGKHVQAYVNNLNNLLPNTPFERASLEEIIKKAEGGIFNNAAQVWNHTFYFHSFTPKGGSRPTGDLLQAINAAFGNFDEFKKQFVADGASIFGSGWVWLVKDADKKLSIVKAPNAENPLRNGFTPLLTFDVWEHAYYLDYQNRRPDHLNSLWVIINWDIINERFLK